MYEEQKNDRMIDGADDGVLGYIIRLCALFIIYLFLYVYLGAIML